MGRRRQHGMRPLLRPIGTGTVKRIHAIAERRRIAADVVQRNEPVVDIKTGVLHALGHHRCGQLLELAREKRGLRGQRRIAGRCLAQDSRFDEIEDAGIDGAAVPACKSYGPFDIPPVFRRHFIRDVGAVDRKRNDDFRQGAAQRVEREIPRGPVGAGEAHQSIGQHRQFARQGATQDLLLRALRDFRERGIVSDEGLVDARDPRFSGRIDEQAIDDIAKAISCGAADRPAFRHGFERRDYFFYADIEWFVDGLDAGRCRRRHGAQPVLQALEVRCGIEQPVGMIDAQCVHHAGRHQFEHQFMSRLECQLVLHPHGSQVIDVEKTAIVDFVRCDAPVGEPVGLGLQQLVQ